MAVVAVEVVPVEVVPVEVVPVEVVPVEVVVEVLSCMNGCARLMCTGTKSIECLYDLLKSGFWSPYGVRSLALQHLLLNAHECARC